MKRICVLFVILLCGCGNPSTGILPTGLNRDEIMPLSLIEVLYGSDMKLAYDQRDNREGRAGWAWEEVSGAAKLLLVELYMPPADCNGLYNKVKTGAKQLTAPKGMQACCDNRAVYLRWGVYYIRVVTLGLTQTNDALELLQARLARTLGAGR